MQQPTIIAMTIMEPLMQISSLKQPTTDSITCQWKTTFQDELFIELYLPSLVYVNANSMHPSDGNIVGQTDCGFYYPLQFPSSGQNLINLFNNKTNMKERTFYANVCQCGRLFEAGKSSSPKHKSYFDHISSCAVVHYIKKNRHRISYTKDVGLLCYLLEFPTIINSYCQQIDTYESRQRIEEYEKKVIKTLSEFAIIPMNSTWFIRNPQYPPPQTLNQNHYNKKSIWLGIADYFAPSTPDIIEEKEETEEIAEHDESTVELDASERLLEQEQEDNRTTDHYIPTLGSQGIFALGNITDKESGHNLQGNIFGNIDFLDLSLTSH